MDKGTFFPENVDFSAWEIPRNHENMTTEVLDPQEKATNHDTWRHIHRVQHYLLMVVKVLIDRAHKHDQSKLAPPEVGPFSEVTDRLAGITYGSQEYIETTRTVLGPALVHHYANNRHHPEHFVNGVNDMTLVDLMEMFCDWKAASERHQDGNIRKSIDINAERFDMSPQLRRIFENTINVIQ